LPQTLYYNMGCAASVIFSGYDKLVVDLDHLFLTRVIGSGGFGTVYSALHLDYSSWYAVKQVGKAELLSHDAGVDMIMVGSMRHSVV
jgi:hypothetical protein